MYTKKTKRLNPIFELLIILSIMYFTLRVISLYQTTSCDFLEGITIVSDNIFDFSSPFILNQDTLLPTIFVGIFSFALIENIILNQHKNRQEETYGSAEWGETTDLDKYKDRKNILNNIIFTKQLHLYHDMRRSDRNRNILLLGRPGSGKTRSFYLSNILNAIGSIFVTDPKGEILRCCGRLLKMLGFDIRVLNLDEKYKSNHYNPFKYIRKTAKTIYNEELYATGGKDNFFTEEILKEDDVMSLINIIIKNTKSDSIQQQTGDPFWEKAEIVFLQAIFYYVLFRLPENEKNFCSVMKLIKFATPDEKGHSKLDDLFEKWREIDPENIGIKQYDLYKNSRGKMTNTIIMTAAARFAPFNISEINELVKTDEMELERMGQPGKKGKIIWFVITKPNDTTFNFLANIFYTQAFNILDQNAQNHNGWLPTPVQFYLEEWAQLGELPLFLQNLAYIRGLNAGIVIGLQSLDQLKKLYRDDWETVLDCCDSLLFLGSRSKFTLDYIRDLLGDKTWYKRSQSRQYGRNGHSSHSWDVVARKLATTDELLGMESRHGILLMAGCKHPFYDDTYDIKYHPRYPYLYEPREHEKTKINLYDHYESMMQQKVRNQTKTEFEEMGIKCEVVDQIFTTSFDVTELKKMKYKVITEKMLEEE